MATQKNDGGDGQEKEFLRSRREFLKAGAGAIGGLAVASGGPRFVLAGEHAGPSPKLAIPFDGKMGVTVGRAKLELNGPHRFLRIGYRTGFQPLSLKTKLRIGTDLHCRSKGSILLKICPLETLAPASAMQDFISKDPRAQWYNLMGDGWPARDASKTVFSWEYTSRWEGQMVAKFMHGWQNNDFGFEPYAFVEQAPLQEKYWYQLAFTWNLPEHRMAIYINGIRAGATFYPFKPVTPRPELYLGNTAMVFSDFRMYGGELSAREVGADYAHEHEKEKPEVRKQLLDLYTVQPKPRLDWKPGNRWKLAYKTSFTRPEDLKGWKQQGCTGNPYHMKEFRTTPEGLLLETPEHMGTESRMYLWSPQNFEGDVAVAFEFRPERDSGLALLVAQASGMQREDFINDHPPRTSGSMATIIDSDVRNYHWEFYRRNFYLDIPPKDDETEALFKNPWRRPFPMTRLPKLEVGKFHRLLFLQEGPRLRAVIDEQVAIDVRDTPWGYEGPVFSYGRIGLRLMQRTRLTFRDLRIWNHNPGVEVV